MPIGRDTEANAKENISHLRYQIWSSSARGTSSVLTEKCNFKLLLFFHRNSEKNILENVLEAKPWHWWNSSYSWNLSHKNSLLTRVKLMHLNRNSLELFTNANQHTATLASGILLKKKRINNRQTPPSADAHTFRKYMSVSPWRRKSVTNHAVTAKVVAERLCWVHVRVWGRGFITVANQSVRVQVWVHEGTYVEMSISVVL